MTDPLLAEIHHICQFFFSSSPPLTCDAECYFFFHQNGTFQSWPRYYSLSTALLKKTALSVISHSAPLNLLFGFLYALSPSSIRMLHHSHRGRWIVSGDSGGAALLCRNLHLLLERCCIIKSVASIAGWEIRINRETVLILVVSHKVCLQLHSNRISIHPFTVCHVPIHCGKLAIISLQVNIHQSWTWRKQLERIQFQ